MELRTWEQTRHIQRIRVDRIGPAELRLRPIDESVVDGLLLSIQQCGLLQPIMVSKRGEDFTVIFGNHRLEACRRLGWTEIPAIVEQANDQEMFLLQVVENIQRHLTVNPVEEARGYEMLVRNGMTIHEIASRIGKSYQYVWSRLRLLKKLHPKILDGIRNGRFERITTSHAEQLSMLKDSERQLELAEAIEDHNISVGGLEKMVYRELSEGSANSRGASMQVYRKGYAVYEQGTGGTYRITLMSDSTLRILAKYLGKRGRTGGREAGRIRRRAFLEHADKTVSRLEFLTRIFNEGGFGWGKLLVTDSKVIISEPIMEATDFITGYMEGYLGLRLRMTNSLGRLVFTILGKVSPCGETVTDENSLRGC